MARVLTTHAADRRATSPAGWILLIVSVTVATVMAVSVPRLIEPKGWASGEKFLFLALLGYLGATALNAAYLALGEGALFAGARAFTRGGFMLHTAAIAVRWATAGHAPLSNIYEMVLVFSWGVVGLELLAEWKYALKFLGAVTLPVAALALVLMQVLPGEIRPLVPALDSTWLQIHVTLAMLSYAGFTLSFAVALLFLIKDGTSLKTFLNWAAGLVAGIYGAIVISSVSRDFALLVPAWDAEAGEKILVAPKQALLVPIAALGWPFVMVLVLAVAAIAANLFATFSARAEVGAWPRRLHLASLFAQGLGLVLLLVKVESGPYFVPRYAASFAVHLAGSPFLLAGIVSALFVSLGWEILSRMHNAIVRVLPERERLDDLIYRTVAVSFPLLTLMIISGAYWANRTWGSYWSWDPKEDWALITWLTYAGYLHMRMARGWRGRRAAYMALIGFAIVMFTFFGVTYLLPGLHAYA